MSDRKMIVVDCETNGLDPERHQAVEVAWWNLNTDERGLFIPRHDRSAVLAKADVEALRINRYIDRIAGAEQDVKREATRSLWEQLHHATIVGSNPAFDAGMLAKLFTSMRGEARSSLVVERPKPWHHRMWDLSAYAAGVLGLDELPGLAKVCDLLGVQPGDHTAEADVTATGLCFRRLKILAHQHPAAADVEALAARARTN